MTPDKAIEAAAAVEAEVRYRLQLARQTYEAGKRDGYRQRQAEEEARWRQTPRTTVPDGPSHAELEERRWGPRGRQHFADPRHGDFPGRAQHSTTGRVLRYEDPQRVTEIWSPPRLDGTLASASRPHLPAPKIAPLERGDLGLSEPGQGLEASA